MTITETAWLDALYRNSSVGLLAYLRRRCKTPEDAADCLAETFLVAWRKRAERPKDDELRPWLFGIARNLAHQRHQHDGRLASATKALADCLADPTITSDDAKHEAGLELRRALTELPPLDQEIVTMISWDGLKPKEVAQILGLSPNVVRVRAHRARTRLREELRPKALETLQPRQDNF